MANTSEFPRWLLCNDTRTIQISWSESEQSDYHFVWLRHSARCTYGMPNDTSVKIDLLPDDPRNLEIVKVDRRDNLLLVEWTDNHLLTEHDLDALRLAAYDDASRAQRKHRPTLWTRDSAADIPRFEFLALHDDSRLLDLLLAVRDYGLAKVTGVPAEPGSVRQIAERFGPIHVNNYGDLFDVRSDANRGLGSNTGVCLPPHTDESYRHEVPGISFFHCIQASATGGESTLVDGFAAAEALRQTDPESYDVLGRVPIFFQRCALPNEDMRSHARVLVTDIDGDLVGVRWTDRTLPPQDLPANLMEPVYHALQKLWKIISQESMRHIYSMHPGDLHVFDNHRVLHGRQAFDVGSGARHLQQCSVNRDEFHNTLRVLAAAHGHDARQLVMAGGAGG